MTLPGYLDPNVPGSIAAYQATVKKQQAAGLRRYSAVEELEHIKAGTLPEDYKWKSYAMARTDLPIMEAGMPIKGLLQAGKSLLGGGILTKAKTVLTRGVGSAVTKKKAVVPTLQTLKTALLTKAQEFIQKPLRTALPYVATGGLLGEATDYGTKKGEVKETTGGLIGQAVTPPYLLPAATSYTPPAVWTPPITTGIPALDLLRGQPAGVLNMATNLQVQPPPFVRTWSTGTATFGVDQYGNHWVTTKNGWKKYSKRKPIVLGTRNLTPSKFIAAAKRYHKMYKDLDKIFKKVRVKRKSS